MLQIEDFQSVLKETDTDELLRRAEEAMQGMLVLNGTGPAPVFVGIPPRWEENPCGIGGYTWTMSRLNYMVTLCKAFLLTGERRYLDKVETDLADWFEQIPTPPVPHDYKSACYYHGVHNWRMLEVGYRMVYTFPVLLGVLRVHGRDEELLKRIYQSIAEHAERIAAGSHLLWPKMDHNHYTQEVNGLLSAAAMIPDHPKAASWMDQAVEGLESACANQITEDGAQIEGAALYHTAVVMDFLYSLHFAEKCGRGFSPAFVARVRKGIEYSVHTMAPDGTMLPFGDADQLTLTPVGAACMGYLLFGDTRYLATLRQFLPAEQILQTLADLCPWGFGHAADLIAWLKKPLQEEENDLLPPGTCQKQMDYYILRTGWDRKAACLLFSCHSPIHYGNHAHMDQLGIIFAAYGKVLLQDPGRYTYKSCEDRHLYKSSQVHTVPTVNGRDGFEYVDTFGYGPQKDGGMTAIADTGHLKGVSGTHHNYDPVTISRSVALVDGCVLAIADTYSGLNGEEMKAFFHINSTNVGMDGLEVLTDDRDVNLGIVPVNADAGWKAEILEGRLSDVFYHDYPSKRAVYSCTAREEREMMLFLVVPSAAGDETKPENVSWDGSDLRFGFRGVSYQVCCRDGKFTEAHIC